MISSRVAIVPAALSLLLSSAAVPANAVAAAPDYIRTAYDGVIYEVTDDSAEPLSWEGWASRGFPGFQNADTLYYKVLSFKTVTAVTAFERAGLEVDHPLTFDEYRNAGYPVITEAAWGPDIEVYKWSTSSELFAQDSSEEVVKLTYGQWRDAEFPAYSTRDNRGFVRLSWDGSGGIAYMCNIGGGRGGRLTYEQWSSLGSPTPAAVTRTANDAVWKISQYGDTLSYVGAMNLDYRPGDSLSAPLSNRSLLYAEWVAMGAPVPLRALPDSAKQLSCSSQDPSPWS